MQKFPLYRDALAKLCGPGVALADLTSMWAELLKRKSFYDLTGNGLKDPDTAFDNVGSVIPCEPEMADLEKAVLG